MNFNQNMLWQAFIKGFWTKWHPDKIKKSSPYQNKAMNVLITQLF
jgi:hypothetical protein